MPYPEDLADEGRSEDPEGAAIRSADARTTWEALAALPARQGLVLYLRHVEGRPYKEIGQLLNCSQSAVETLLFRARQSFTRAFGQMEASQEQRCRMLKPVMAAVFDDEANELQKRAMGYHLEECGPCRKALGQTRRAVAGYVALPMLPLTHSLLLPALGGTGAIVGGASATGVLGNVLRGLGLITLNAKAAVVGVVVLGGVVTTAAGVDYGIEAPAAWFGGETASVATSEVNTTESNVALPPASPLVTPAFIEPVGDTTASASLEDESSRVEELPLVEGLTDKLADIVDTPLLAGLPSLLTDPLPELPLLEVALAEVTLPAVPTMTVPEVPSVPLPIPTVEVDLSQATIEPPAPLLTVPLPTLPALPVSTPKPPIPLP